jgi:hypothetical protein
MSKNANIDISFNNKPHLLSTLRSGKIESKSHFQRLFGHKNSLLVNESDSSERNGFFKSFSRVRNSTEQNMSETQSRIREAIEEKPFGLQMKMEQEIACMMDDYSRRIKTVESFIKENEFDFFDHRRSHSRHSHSKTLETPTKRNSFMISKLLIRRKGDSVQITKSEMANQDKKDKRVRVKPNYDFNFEFDGYTISVINFFSNQKHSMSLKELFNKTEQCFRLFYESSSQSLEEMTYRFKTLVDYDNSPHQDIIGKLFLTSASLINTHFKVSKLYKFMDESYQTRTFKRILVLKDRLTKVSQSELGKLNNRATSASKNFQINYGNASKQFSNTFYGSNPAKLNSRLRNDSASKTMTSPNKTSVRSTTVIDFLKAIYSIYHRLLEHIYQSRYHSIKQYVKQSNVVMHNVENLESKFRPRDKKEQNSQTTIQDALSQQPRNPFTRLKNLTLPHQDISSFNQMLHRYHSVLTENCNAYLKTFKKPMI